MFSRHVTNLCITKPIINDNLMITLHADTHRADITAGLQLSLHEQAVNHCEGEEAGPVCRHHHEIYIVCPLEPHRSV